jgi:hypothetical protein
LLSRESWLDKSELHAYREYVKSEDRETEGYIRKCTSTGRPVGTEVFLKKLEQMLGRAIMLKKAGRPRKVT